MQQHSIFMKDEHESCCNIWLFVTPWLLCPWNFPGNNTGVSICFSRGSSQPRDQPPGKPNNTGVGSLRLLQGIFLIQESNQDPLHHRQILYIWSTGSINSFLLTVILYLVNHSTTNWLVIFKKSILFSM